MNDDDFQALDSIYWLVLRPLYFLLKRLELQTPEEIFKDCDLLKTALTSALEDSSLSEEHLKGLISHLVRFLPQTEAAKQTHISLYKELAKLEKYEPLRAHYLEKVEESTTAHSSQLLQELAVIPNAATGLRHSFLRGKMTIKEALTVADPTAPLQTMTVPHPPPNTIAVRVCAPFLTRNHYLRKEVVDQILIVDGSHKGHIKRSSGDPKNGGSAHPVSPARWNGYQLHFKEMPSHPLMNEVVHNLNSRLKDGLTPSEFHPFRNRWNVLSRLGFRNDARHNFERMGR